MRDTIQSMGQYLTPDYRTEAGARCQLWWFLTSIIAVGIAISGCGGPYLDTAAADHTVSAPAADSAISPLVTISAPLEHATLQDTLQGVTATTLATPTPATPTFTPAAEATPTASATPTPAILLSSLLPTPTPAAEPSPTLAPTPDGIARTVRLPILMYHYLSAPPPGADVYRTDLSVPPDRFAEHLDHLLAAGYTTVSLYDLVAYLTRGVPLPEHPVILTFDDGYRDNYTNAFPLLVEREMTATFFVVSDFLDEERPEYLTWDMAREMLAAGMSIESHGRNHFSLEKKDTDYLVWQALGSLETIEFELGTRPRFVSYPAGDYDQNTIAVFHSAGYWGGVTTVQGMAQRMDHLFELERIRVRNTTSADELLRLMSLDW